MKGAVKEGDDLAAGAMGIRAEGGLACAGGDTFHVTPGDGFKGPFGGIGKGEAEHPGTLETAAVSLDIAVEEGDDLSTGTSGVRAERAAVAGAFGDPSLNGP